jgi:hypothetical protein
LESASLNATPRPQVLIATPTPGTVKTAYMRSVIAMIRDLAARGIKTDFDTWEGSDIAGQRNVLASRFLRRADFTHLFFVDADMVLPSGLCARLIALDKPVIGAIYPAKTFDPAQVERAIKDGVPLRKAMMGGMNWHFWGGTMSPSHPVCEVDALPFGAVLIQRGVFTTMVGRGHAVEDKAPANAGGPRFNFFGARTENVTRGRHLQEDISFCQRWKRDCGGEIWAVLDAEIAHIGDFFYGGGSLWKLIETQRAAENSPGPIK